MFEFQIWNWLAALAALVIVYKLLDRYVRTVPLAEPWRQEADGRIDEAFLRSNNPEGLGLVTADIIRQWTRHGKDAVIVSAQGHGSRFVAIAFMGPSKVRFTGKPLIEIEFAVTNSLTKAKAFLRSCDDIKVIKHSKINVERLGRHLGAFVEGTMPIDVASGLPRIDGYLAPNDSIQNDKLMTFLFGWLVR